MLNMEGAEACKDKLMGDFKNVLRDIETLLSEQKGHLKEGAEELKERLEVGVKRVKSQLGELECAVTEKSKEAAKVTDDFVHDHPWESIGVGVGIGLLVGLLLGRR
jgi:ElaB/YqjD/DUF883 family membrane-anchored ribosome-binding protein